MAVRGRMDNYQALTVAVRRRAPLPVVWGSTLQSTHDPRRDCRCIEAVLAKCRDIDTVLPDAAHAPRATRRHTRPLSARRRGVEFGRGRYGGRGPRHLQQSVHGRGAGAGRARPLPGWLCRALQLHRLHRCRYLAGIAWRGAAWRAGVPWTIPQAAQGGTRPSWVQYLSLRFQGCRAAERLK